MPSDVTDPMELLQTLAGRALQAEIMKSILQAAHAGVRRDTIQSALVMQLVAFIIGRPDKMVKLTDNPNSKEAVAAMIEIENRALAALGTEAETFWAQFGHKAEELLS